MCFGGGKQQSVEVPPPPAPAPVPTPQDTNPLQSADQKRNRIQQLKYGMLSTIKTSGQGVTGTGPDLNTPVATGSNKNTLGA